MSNFTSLSSLAMDLDRVSIGLYRKSDAMAQRFIKEALMRKKEVDMRTVKPYIARLLEKMEFAIESGDREKRAENALMYSTLFRNAAIAEPI